MHITLVRHTKTNIDPKVSSLKWTLSEEGRDLAVELAKSDLLANVQAVYSSTQPKAIETAQILADPRQAPALQEEGLAELSSVTNGFIEDYNSTVHKLYMGEIDNINSGETLQEALDRFNKAINAISEKHNDSDNIAIVSHANVLSLFTAQFCDKKAIDLHGSIAMPDIAVLDWSLVDKKFIKFWGTNE